MKKRLFAIFLTLAMVLTVLPITVAAADTAAVIKLTETSGTVTVSKSNGKSVTLRDEMRLYNGYNVTTAAGSYAWISLDSTKLLKVDASSSVEVRKDGSKLEVNIKYGSMYFEVTQKLNSNESLNISSSTMTVGIRGTSGWVRVTNQWATQASILEGSSQCVVADPVTNQLKSAQISGGQTAQCVVYPRDHEGDKCDIVMEQQTTEEIPGFVLTELVENVALCDKILDDAGLDVLADLAKGTGGDPSGRSPDGKSASLEVLHKAEQRQSQEETETAQKQEKIEEQLEQQENNISQESVWEQPGQTEQPGQPSSGSSAPSTPTTYTIRLNANGGTVTSTSLSTNADGRLATLPTPTRPDFSFTSGATTVTGVFTFGGWYDAAGGGAVINTGTVFTKDTTVYAHWTAAVTVSGTGSMEDYAFTSPIEPWHEFSTLISALTVESGVTSLGNYAFNGCTALTTVTLPATVNNIGSYTFENCKSLTNITLPDSLTQIQKYTFRGCTSLTDITLPEGVDTVDEGAFQNCTSLASVYLPESVKTIRLFAFQNTALTSITIPGGVTMMDEDVFTGCTALTDIYFGGTQAQWDAYGCDVPNHVTIHCTDTP